jgi:hypothetical protein
MPLRARVDVVTRAILAHLDHDLQKVLDGCRERSDQGPVDYVVDLPWMVGTRHQMPSLSARPDGVHLVVGARLQIMDDVTVFGDGPGPEGPMVMVTGTLLSETILATAPGHRLADVVDTEAHDILARLGDVVVAAVENGDTQAAGGSAFCRIMLEADRREEILDTGRRWRPIHRT